MAASLSPQERTYYDQLYAIVDKDGAGVLPGHDALPFLVTSGLPQQTLGEIWAVADPDNNGFLTRDGWYKAARLIGWLQKGGQTTVDETLASKPGPYPSFQGHPPPPPQLPLSAQSTGQRPTQLSTQLTGSGLPPISAADRTKFTRIFVGCGPQNGLVSGDKARDVFLKSQLSYDKLGQIWNLADTQQRGSLDLPDFIIGMFLIQSCMANPSLVLPATLPPGTYEQASGGRPPPTSPVVRQNTGTQSPVRPQYTGQGIQPQRTGQSVSAQPTGTPPRPNVSSFGSGAPSAFGTSAFSPSRQASGIQQQWDVTPEAKATSDRFFAQLDPQGKGVIEGDVAVPFMLQSQLDEASLANIWDLADIRHEGRLGRDEFAVAMHLINAKLAGKDVPASLPASLIPPSLRGELGSGTQEVLAPGVSSTTKDLFDLFDDTPAPAPAPTASPPPATAPPFSTTAFLPQPPSRSAPSSRMSPATTGVPAATGFGMAPFAPTARSPPPSDLLGDDSAEAPRAVPDNSAEIGNKQNHLTNTTRSLTDLEKTRSELESSASNSAKQLEELEEKLSSARVRHEAETKAVGDLRIRVGEQNAKLKQLNADVISAESDLTAMKLEKDELEQAVLRDKEEVRGLQRKMKEVEDEKTGLKLVLEKLRKESRQQKGLVTIAKKQVSTAESGRDAVQQEIREVEKAAEEPEPVHAESAFPAPQAFSPSSLSTAAAVPLPATPKALSPAPTGASQRSNNPFDRLGRGPKPPAPEAAREISSPQEPTSPSLGTAAVLGAGAAVGAAAGVVAAGASTLFSAAKEAVTGEHEEQPEAGSTQDPFGAEVATDTATSVARTDPFGAPTAHPEPESEPKEETDPFGAPSTSGPAPSSFESQFDHGFGDSFGVAPAQQPTSSHTDFDAAFADFDEKAEEAPAPKAPAPVEPFNEEPLRLAGEAIPAGIPKSALPDLKLDVERSMSTQAVAPSSVPDSPVVEETVLPAEPEAAGAAQEHVKSVAAEEASSDEDEGPEDLEGPQKGYHGSSVEKTEAEPIERAPTSASPPDLSSPVTSETAETGTQKVRRSAPPPPSAKTSGAVPPSVADFDPFGAPVSSGPAPVFEATHLPPGAAAATFAPNKSSFEDDDFDFSDLPPAQVEHAGAGGPPPAVHTATSSAFDDEFANFDDEFDKPSTGQGSDGSNGMSKSYEMVSPNQPSAPEASALHYDEWGFGNSKKTVEPQPAAGGFTFDDAFGGDFEPAPAPQEQYAPPPGPPPGAASGAGGSLNPPALPERRESGAQADDLEDVKKLCAMGFPRSLVVEALDANGYDFQKALNVLLVQ